MPLSNKICKMVRKYMELASNVTSTKYLHTLEKLEIMCAENKSSLLHLPFHGKG
jgi:hypothetical protein